MMTVILGEPPTTVFNTAEFVCDDGRWEAKLEHCASWSKT